MLTICPSDECKQKYNVPSNFLGSNARCKKCNNIFKIEELKEPLKVIELDADEEDDNQAQTDENGFKRRSPQEVMEEHINTIKQSVNDFLPNLNKALRANENESGTRLLIDKMLQNILGYRLEDIRTEQKIEGRRADYILSVRGVDKLIIEVKKIGMPLKCNQIFQATSYGAYSGIKWVVLTNALVWQLYHISTGDKIETDLIFSIDLMDGLSDKEANYFYLISSHGISRKSLLDRLWQKISSLCYDNIINAILTDEVITRIRGILKKQTGFNITNDDVRTTIEENIFQIS